MFEIIFLGTSASAPSVYRNLPAALVIAGEHRFLVDCGEGTQRQILKSGVGFRKLNKILLTHAHLDHILGIGGMVSTFTSWDEMFDQLDIYGGAPAIERVHALIYEVVLRGKSSGIPIYLNELEPGLIMETREFTLSAFPVTHRGRGNFGFVFEEHAKRPFLNDKAEALGVPVGPERGRLVKGETVTLNDGREIKPEMVLGETIPGTRLVYVGDTASTENLRSYVEGADTLVIEATFLDSEAEEASSFGHITAKQSALLAQECGVKSLLLNHVSRRYRERDIIEEVRSVFPDAYVVRDLDHFVIKRGAPAKKHED
jgi:ribonuclease Z